MLGPPVRCPAIAIHQLFIGVLLFSISRSASAAETICADSPSGLATASAVASAIELPGGVTMQVGAWGSLNRGRLGGA
jgi:hypothetical protein